MYQQTAFYLSKFRMVLAGIFAVVFVLSISAVVTSVGNDSVLASKTNPYVRTPVDLSDDPNVVSDAAANLATSAKQGTLAVGRAMYQTCRSITKTSDHTGGAIVHGSADVADSVGHSAAFINHEVASAAAYTLHIWGQSILFTLHIPGRIINSTSNVHAISSIIQPPDNNPVPVINTKLSAAELATIDTQIQQDAENQQKVKALQAAQAADNRNLDGTVVAGDSNHGGYPTAWDEAPEDSKVDSWGMLNRECVSYTAWKVYQTYGYMPFWGGEGNANEWVGDAQAAGIPTGSTPRVNSVAISMRGYYGHAMWVQKVQGNMIYVSQYNYDMHGHYSEMWVNGSDFTYIYFQ